MKNTAIRVAVILVLLLGSAAVAMVVFKDQVSEVLFADSFDDY